MKLIVDGVTQRIVGAHLLAHEAAEMIQFVAVAMTMGATKADFDATVAVHPTAAEELVTMRSASDPLRGRHASRMSAGCGRAWAEILVLRDVALKDVDFQ